MKFLRCIGIATLLICHSLPLWAENINTELKLIDWQFRDRAAFRGEGDVEFVSLTVLDEKLKFEVITHNSSQKFYHCLYITATTETVHIDDNLGNEYKGMEVVFYNELDNKFAVNQRKKVFLYLPKPVEEASLLNFHFGFYFHMMQHRDSNKKCSPPLGDHGYNFHKIDWDASQLVSQAKQPAIPE